MGSSSTASRPDEVTNEHLLKLKMNSKLIVCLLVCSILLAVFHDSEGWRRRRRRRRSGKMDESALENSQEGAHLNQKQPVRAPHVRDEVEQLFDEEEEDNERRS